VSRAAVRAPTARRRLRRSPPLLAHLRVLRALHLLPHRQPGPGRLPHRAAIAPSLAAVLERGGVVSRPAPPRAGALALQPLPALLDRPDRDTRPLLFPLPERRVRLGDAARARGAPLARTTVSGAGGHEARGQWLRIGLMVPALLGIILLGQAIL